MQWRYMYCSGSVAHKRMNWRMFISKLPVKQGSSFNFTNKHSSRNCNTVILNWLMVVMLLKLPVANCCKKLFTFHSPIELVHTVPFTRVAFQESPFTVNT